MISYVVQRETKMNVNPDGSSEFTRVFHAANCSSKEEAENAPGIPRRGDPYEGSGLKADSVNAKPTDDPNLWVVEVVCK